MTDVRRLQLSWHVDQLGDVIRDGRPATVEPISRDGLDSPIFSVRFGMIMVQLPVRSP